MKTIVISGAHSNVGKTRLAEELCQLLQGAAHVKIGHGEEKEDAGNIFFHVGTPYSRIEREIGQVDLAVIESNRVLEEMTPDCAIYLTGGEPKPSAAGAIERADIVRGMPVARKTIEGIASRLELDESVVIEIARLAGARPDE